jgi:hypothetical protein
LIWIEITPVHGARHTDCWVMPNRANADVGVKLPEEWSLPFKKSLPSAVTPRPTKVAINHDRLRSIFLQNGKYPVQ